MTKLEQLHLFLKFHFAPDSDAKREVWNTCCPLPYSEEYVILVCRDIDSGGRELTEFEIKMLRIVAEPSPPRDPQWAEKVQHANNTVDREAAHVDADLILCELLQELGYSQTVAAWRAVDKWYV